MGRVYNMTCTASVCTKCKAVRYRGYDFSPTIHKVGITNSESVAEALQTVGRPEVVKKYCCKGKENVEAVNTQKMVSLADLVSVMLNRFFFFDGTGYKNTKKVVVQREIELKDYVMEDSMLADFSESIRDSMQNMDEEEKTQTEEIERGIVLKIAEHERLRRLSEAEVAKDFGVRDDKAVNMALDKTVEAATQLDSMRDRLAKAPSEFTRRRELNQQVIDVLTAETALRKKGPVCRTRHLVAVLQHTVCLFFCFF
jgi:hypothetical protein